MCGASRSPNGPLSHILSEVEETCDLLLMLNDGELIASGSEQELLGRTRHALDFELQLVGEGLWNSIDDVKHYYYYYMH